MNRPILPDPCQQILQMGAWLVGGAVAYVEGEVTGQPRDFDIMVPPDQWQNACRLIKACGYPVELNRMGGLKISLSDDPNRKIELDVWPGTVESFLSEMTVPPEGVRLLRYRPWTRLAVGCATAPTWARK